MTLLTAQMTETVAEAAEQLTGAVDAAVEAAVEAAPAVAEVEQAAEQVAEVATEAAATWGWNEMLSTAAISIGLVFFVLVLLILVMLLFGALLAKKPAKAPAKTSSAGREVANGQLHNAEVAAIAAALKLYKSELHDRESDVLTITAIKRAYSPWNSKIHGLIPMPERK